MSGKSATVGRYHVDVASFEKIALPALEDIPNPSLKSPSSTDADAVAVPCGIATSSDRPADSKKNDSGLARETEADCESKVNLKTESEIPQASISRGRLIVIDEIGKMELFSRPFVDSVGRLFDQTPPPLSGRILILATIPVASPRSSCGLVEDLRHHDDCRLFQVL